MIYEFVYVKIHYQCGHEAIRPELIARVGKRERWSYERCSHCTDQLARRYAIAHEVEREQEERLPVFPTGEWPPKPREVERERAEEVAI